LHALFEETNSQLRVGRNTSGNEHRGGASAFGGAHRLADEIFDHRVLERCDQVEHLVVAKRKHLVGRERVIGREYFVALGGGCGQAVQFDIAGDGRLYAAVRKIDRVLGIVRQLRAVLVAEMRLGLDLRKGERDGARIAMRGERGDPRTAGVAEAEHTGHLIEGFAGSIVHGATGILIAPRAIFTMREK